MKSKIGIFILFFIYSISCRNEQKSLVDSKIKKAMADSIAKVQAVQPTNAVRPDTVIKSSFDNPEAMARNKYSHFDQILMKDLCYKVWKYDAGIDGMVAISPEQMQGKWLQFFEDGRYEQGIYNKITSHGKFTVDNLGFIEFSPADTKEKKTEYQSKFNNDMLIMVGTPKFQDNKIQMRLSRVMEKPKKQ
jgi:hypothetical protein